MKKIFLTVLVFLGMHVVLAEEAKFEGTYHSDKNVKEKIVITKIGDKTYSIVNQSGKWTALAAKGVGRHTKGGDVYDYYKGIISWPKEELENVGYINMTLRKDGKSIGVVHRWNFWVDAKNSSDSWSEDWVKESN